MAACVLAWWLTQRPSNDRDWDPNFEKLAAITINGDEVTVGNVRNTHYRSLNDYDCRYEDRSYNLSQLKAVDLLVIFWGSTAVSHPAAIFDFGTQGHLCISIEVRYRANGKYELLPNFFRQNELMYVVSDERDAILRRTLYSEGQDCYLYRLQTTSNANLELFLEYSREINELLDKPRWYNLLFANCTTCIYRQHQGKMAWDWRIVFNGAVDRMLYEWGRLYQQLPFEELKSVSLINDRANAAEPEDFGKQIRKGLPGFELVER